MEGFIRGHNAKCRGEWPEGSAPWMRCQAPPEQVFVVDIDPNFSHANKTDNAICKHASETHAVPCLTRKAMYSTIYGASYAKQKLLQSMLDASESCSYAYAWVYTI